MFRDLASFPGFAHLWWARLAGTAASQILMVALGWHLYTLTGSAWDLGLVGLVQFAPQLLLILPAGHVADHANRARVVAVCLAIQALAGAAMVTTTWVDHANRDTILAVSAVLGAVRAFQMPAQQALVSMIVPGAQLSRAISVMTTGIQAAIIVGPAVGGFLYALGETVVYSVCTLLSAAGFIWMMRLRAVARVDAPECAADRSLGHLLAGVRFVWRHPIVLGAMTLDLFAVLLGGATALLPIYAKDILQCGPTGLGFLRAAPAVGALLMSMALLRWPLERRAGRQLLGSVAVYGVATLVFGLSTEITLSWLALAISGAADNVSVVIRQTLVQLETPDEMRGRVSAVNSIFIGASNQLGEFESGATAAVLGPVGSVVLGGIGTIALALTWGRWFPGLAQRDRMTP